MIIELPELPDLNSYIRAERTNRFRAAKIKRDSTALVSMYIKKSGATRIGRISKIMFIWHHKDRRKDFDNVEFGQKFIRDGMVKAGIVDGDGWLYFPPKTTHKHELGRTGVTLIYK
jgi:hypothetical protein